MPNFTNYFSSGKHWVLPLLCGLLLSSQASKAVQPLPNNWPTHPAQVDTSGFALILGGGGARGIAHIGVIEVLEELGMRPSLIVGTSMGSVVGSLYASGMTSSELRQLALSQNLLTMIVDVKTPPADLQGGWWGQVPYQLCLQMDQWPPLPGTGFIRGQSFESMVGENTADALFAAGSNFDQLPIPFRCVSTDLINSSMVVHDQGFLPRAVKASSSIPLVFYPVELDGNLLVDGGMLDNVPIQIARRLGFNRAVIVDVSNVHLPDKQVPEDISEMFIRVVEIQTLFPNDYSANDNDVVLKMPLEPYRAMDMTAASDILTIGYDTASQYKDQLLSLRNACGDVARNTPPKKQQPGLVTLKTITVEGLEHMQPSRVLDQLQMHEGDTIYLASAWKKAEWLAKHGSIQTIGFEFTPLANGTAAVIVHVQEESRPHLELGANYLTDNSPAFMARLRYDNLMGRNDSNLLSYQYSDRQSCLDAILDQPINGSGWLTLHSKFRWQRERPGLYSQGIEVDQYVFRRTQLSLDIAVHSLDRDWTLYLGGDYGQTNSYLENRQTASSGNQNLSTIHLTLESHGRDLPASRPFQGMRLGYTHSIAEKDDAPKWWRTDFGMVRHLQGLGKWTPVLATGAVISSDNIPTIHQGRAGGPRGWVGLRQQEIISPQIAWSRIAIQRLLGSGIYVEVAGSVGWYDQQSLSNSRPLWGGGLELGANSLLGPLHLGYAVADSRNGYIYIQVGHKF